MWTYMYVYYLYFDPDAKNICTSIECDEKEREIGKKSIVCTTSHSMPKNIFRVIKRSSTEQRTRVECQLYCAVQLSTTQPRLQSLVAQTILIRSHTAQHSLIVIIVCSAASNVAANGKYISKIKIYSNWRKENGKQAAQLIFFFRLNCTLDWHIVSHSKLRLNISNSQHSTVATRIHQLKHARIAF